MEACNDVRCVNIWKARYTFENNVKCAIDMPTFMPPSPPGTAQEQKNHCQPCKKKEPGTPRNVLYSLPIGISDGPGFRVVGARINNIRYTGNPGPLAQWYNDFFVEMVQKRHLQQGFQSRRRTSYSWSPVPRPRWFQLSTLEPCEQSPSSGRRALHGACFWGLKNKHVWPRGCGPSLCTAKTMLQNRRLKSPERT